MTSKYPTMKIFQAQQTLMKGDEFLASPDLVSFHECYKLKQWVINMSV